MAKPAASPTLPTQPDAGDAYQAVYDLLGTMYWQASDLPTKDQIFGAREEVGEIIDAIDAQQLKDNTAAFKALGPKIALANRALRQIQADVEKITKNISTAASIVAAIGKVIALFPKF